MVEKNHAIADSQVAEATIFTRGPVIRAKESSPDMYAAIDLVTEKLQRQVKKYHDKVQHKALRHAAQGVAVAAVAAGGRRTTTRGAGRGQPAAAAAGDGRRRRQQPRRAALVKSKQFALKPMTVDEATLQLELIGHDFFVFTNAETNDTNVVYRRNDGHYGLIEPARQWRAPGKATRAGRRRGAPGDAARSRPCRSRRDRVI